MSQINGLLKTVKKCELCGSERNLEVPHIIPRAVGGPDTMNNCIVVCGKCHGALTPKGVLSKMGQDRARNKMVSLTDVYARLHDRVNECMEEGVSFTFNDVFDVLDSF